MEWTLQEQGFDLCYDKRLYDRLVSGSSIVRCGGHLQAAPAYQERLLRFIENHDEPRAPQTRSRPDKEARRRSRSCQTLEGAPSVSRGTARGDCTPTSPCSLARGPEQPGRSRACSPFHETLLEAGRRLGLARRRVAALRVRRAGPTNQTAEQMVALVLGAPADLRHLVVVNLADRRWNRPASGLPWDDPRGDGRGACGNLLEDSTFERERQRAARHRAVRRDAAVGTLFSSHSPT